MKSTVITIIVIFVLIVFYAIYQQKIPTEWNAVLLFSLSTFVVAMLALKSFQENLKLGRELKQEKPKLKFEVLPCSVDLGATFIEQNPNTYAVGLYINLKLFQLNDLSREVSVPIELCQFKATIGDSEHKLDMRKWKSNAPDRIEITPHEIRFKGSGGIEYSGEIYGESEEPLLTLILETNYGQTIPFKNIRSEDYEENARWFGLSESGAFDEEDITELIRYHAQNEKVDANANVNEQSSHLDFDEVDFVASPILDHVIPDLDEAFSYDDKLEVKEELSIYVILYQNMRLDKTIHIPFHKCEAYVQNDKGNKFDIPQRQWSWKSESPETIKVTERDIQFEGIGSINFRAYIPLESLVGISVKDRIGWLSQEQEILDWVNSEELSITLVLKTIDGQDISMTIPTKGWRDTWYEYMTRD